MPINTPQFLEMQRTGRQIGELRFGTTTIAKNGKKIPVKLETFRFTTRSERLAANVAQHFDAPYRQVTLNNDQQTYEILTKADSLPVIIPPGEAAIDQWMEMWSGGGCQRRCDGITEQLSQKPCMCPADIDKRMELAAKGKACKITSRVRVMLPDIDGIGVWKIASTGFHAGVELGGDTQRLSAAHAQGINLPAVLWLDKRSEVKDGQTRKYVVPCLDIEKSLREIVAIGVSGSGSLASALSPTAPLAIGTSSQESVSIQADDQFIEAQVTERPAPSSAIAAAPVAGTAPAPAPTPEPAVQIPDDGELADSAAVGALQVQRSQAGLTGGPWLKFVAITLGRSVGANDKFTVQEVATLRAALNESSPAT